MKIAVMGCGTVGAGVCEIAMNDAANYARGAYNEKLEVKYILDIRPLKDAAMEALRTENVADIVNDPEIEVVVEAMGGLHPAFEFCLQCLSARKSVVTSNKLLVAEKAEALFAAAREHNVSFRFGAAVCGGIPVIRTLFYGLAANRVERFAGILNGTSNFILTKMFREQMTNAAALKLAQEKGYAEKDPTDDVAGFDAARKTAILASVCFGSHIYPAQVHTEGVGAITQADVEYAAAANAAVKLLGRGERLPDGRIYVCVSPAMIPQTELLANVNGVYNALKVTGSRVGETLYYGPGAGKDATASAVTADVLDCVRHKGFDTAYCWENAAENRVLPYEEYSTALYVRGCASDKKSAEAAVCALFGGKLLARPNAPENELAFITEARPEREQREALAALEGFTAENVIRMM